MPGGLGAFALLVGAVVILLALVLVWLLAHDRSVTRTSFGWYVQRDRFEQAEEWPTRSGHDPDLDE